MKKLYASLVYSFDNFYSNLNTQGQIIFSIIISLICVLCLLLFVLHVFQSIYEKRKIKRQIKESLYKKDFEEVKKEKQENTVKVQEPLFTNEKTQIEDIASAINEALLAEEKPINLTNFEEDQERTAIISIDELMKKAKELELIEDEKTGVNYLEKYNLEPAEVKEVIDNTMNNEKPKEVIDNTMNNEKPKEVKAFKVSQVISPIYGVRKEIIENNE